MNNRKFFKSLLAERFCILTVSIKIEFKIFQSTVYDVFCPGNNSPLFKHYLTNDTRYHRSNQQHSNLPDRKKF